MRVAQVAPLYESVPPQLYGGTERVVAHLTDELIRQGHDVTLFASGDSRTRARLISPCPRSLRLDPQCADRLAHHMVLLDQVADCAGDFDAIHFHIDYLHFPSSRALTTPHLTTLHGRLDIPDLVPLYRRFRHEPVVSISRAQKRPLPWINWQGTVHHGLPDELFSFQPRAGRYLAFLGRISPEKRVDRAIEIARRAGMNLRIAAKIDPVDVAYFEQVIRPLLGQPHVEFIGEINEHQKCDFLGNAIATLFPIDWPEPFGLVMIESLACGTPVVAWRCGAVPEVITDGLTGFIVHTIDEAVAAVARIPELSRTRCRQEFERRFRAARMAEEYVRIYERLAHRPHEQRAHAHGRSHPGPRSVLHPGNILQR